MSSEIQFLLNFAALISAARLPVAAPGAASGSGNQGKNAFCDRQNYYCLVAGNCQAREIRCGKSDLCFDTCFAVQSPLGLKIKETPLSFYILTKWEYLPGFVGKTLSAFDNWLHNKGPPIESKQNRQNNGREKRRISRFQHLLLSYRGFLYEFGQDYPATEIDPKDPHSKYAFKDDVIDQYTIHGISSCLRSDVLAFNEWWNGANKAYHLTGNNCQDYAHLLTVYLKSNCTAVTTGTAGDRSLSRYLWKLYKNERLAGPCDEASFYCLKYLWQQIVYPKLWSYNA